MASRRELALTSGVLAFDDEVVEAFGFTTGSSQRIPISQLSEVDRRKGILTLSCSGRNILPISISLGKDERDGAELSEFLEAIVSAAPNASMAE